VISLDGDLLVHPEDFRLFLETPRPCLGVGPATTTDAVHARLGTGSTSADVVASAATRTASSGRASCASRAT